MFPFSKIINLEVLYPATAFFKVTHPTTKQNAAMKTLTVHALGQDIDMLSKHCESRGTLKHYKSRTPTNVLACGRQKYESVETMFNWPSQSNLASPIWQAQSGTNLEFRPIWFLGSNHFQSGNDQSRELTLGVLAPDWTQAGETVKHQIYNSNVGQSANLGQIETNLARLLWLGQSCCLVSCYARDTCVHVCSYYAHIHHE